MIHWLSQKPQSSTWLVSIMSIVIAACFGWMIFALLEAVSLIKGLNPPAHDLDRDPDLEFTSLTFWLQVLQRRLAHVRRAVGHAYESHSPLLQFPLRLVFISTLAFLLMGDAGTAPPFSLEKDGENPSDLQGESHLQSTDGRASPRVGNDTPPRTGNQPAPAANSAKSTAPEHRPEWMIHAARFIESGELRAILGWSHFALLLGYLAVAIVCFVSYLRYRTKAPPDFDWTRPHQEIPPPRLCVAGSVLDVLFVTLLGCTSLMDAGHFHLAYLIPLIGVWWVSPHHVRVLSLILGLTMLRVIGAIAASWLSGHLAGKSLGFHVVAPGVMLITLTFWMVMALVVVLLRTVRRELSTKVHAERYIHQALEHLGDKQQHIVFAKDRKRRFTYANPVLLRWFTDLLSKRNLRIQIQELGATDNPGGAAGNGSANGTPLQTDVGRGTEVPDKIFVRKDDQKPISQIHPARLDDILGLTDHDLRIDCVEYLRSDAEVLGLSKVELKPFAEKLGLDAEKLDKLDRELGERTPSFEDFEPNFAVTNPHHKAIWTTKLRICGPDGKKDIVGLVGEANDSQPEQMRRLAERLTNSLPIYALMKEVDPRKGTSHVQWSSRSHLDKIEGRLKQLARAQGLSELLDQPSYPRELLLQRINKGKGPTDEDLYGPPKGTQTGLSPLDHWRHYHVDDVAIVEKAAAVIHKLSSDGMEAPEASVHEELDEELKAWAATTRQKRVEKYPVRGWIERHRFPNSNEDKWVEVRKWPWIESRTENGKKKLFVRGVLVIFEDVTESHIRRNVIWRWVRRHLKHAERASSVYLRDHTLTRTDGSDVSDTPLLQLELLMLGWFRKMVDRPDDPHELDGKPRDTGELRVLINVLECMEKRCKVNVQGLDRPLLFKKGGRDLFAVILVLLINAGQSTVERKRRGGDHVFLDDMMAATLTFETVEENLVITIRDRGVGFAPEDKARIMAGLCWGNGYVDSWSTDAYSQNAGERVLMPGGGILLAKYLLRSLIGIGRDKPIDRNFDITSPRLGDGATVTLRIPWKVLGSDDGKSSVT